MIKEITQSLVKYLADAGLNVAVNNDDLQGKSDFITLSGIEPFVFVDGGNYSKQEISFYINLFGNDEEIYDKLDKLLAIKSAEERAFTVYDLSSGIATQIESFTISMPFKIAFRAPFGKPIMDEIVITIRRRE